MNRWFSIAHQESASHTTAASARTVLPATSPSRATASPSSVTSRKTLESGPACGTIAACSISAPAGDARHWKNSTLSEPRAR